MFGGGGRGAGDEGKGMREKRKGGGREGGKEKKSQPWHTHTDSLCSVKHKRNL